MFLSLTHVVNDFLNKNSMCGLLSSIRIIMNDFRVIYAFSTFDLIRIDDNC
jgi:hypothetical protein